LSKYYKAPPNADLAKKNTTRKQVKKLAKRTRKGKLKWRSKKANHGSKPTRGK
jgi:hypothetical protein